MAARKVAVLVGSLREGIVHAAPRGGLRAMQPTGLDLEVVEIRDLPLYDQDDEESPPQAWTDFRARVRTADAVLFLTPEYNRSIPGALKNAVDVGSRPYGKSVWSGKPCAVVSTSPGAIGGFGANHHLRQCLVFLDMPVLQQPEMYLGGIDKLVEGGGKVAGDSGKQLLSKFLDTFARWIGRNARAA